MGGGGRGGGGGVGEGLILSVLSGIISPACVRTLCAEVIVALMATPIAAIASGPGLVLGKNALIWLLSESYAVVSYQRDCDTPPPPPSPSLPTPL